MPSAFGNWCIASPSPHSQAPLAGAIANRGR